MTRNNLLLFFNVLPFTMYTMDTSHTYSKKNNSLHALKKSTRHCKIESEQDISAPMNNTNNGHLYMAMLDQWNQNTPKKKIKHQDSNPLDKK